MITDYFYLALLALRGRKLRTWLTMLGIFIGIAAVVALISLGQGLQGAILDQFEKVGSDKLFIMPKGTFGAVGLTTTANLTKDDLARLRRVRGVQDAAGHITEGALISLKDERVPAVVGSLPENALERQLVIEVHTYEPEQGRWMKPGQDDAVVIGNDFARTTILTRKLALRDKVTIADREFRVVGILKRVGAPDADGAVFMAEQAVRDTLNLSKDTYSVLIIRVARGADIARVEADVERAMRKSHDVKEGKEDFDVQSPEDLLQTLNTVFAIVQAVLVGIAAISLLVGGIGIMNTMYTSVLERTRDIGVMKAVGARNGDVMLLFLFESGMLGLAGGAVGVALGAGVSKAIEYVAYQALGSPLIKAALPAYLLAGALAFSFIIGAISGIAPAYRAARLRPVEALRR
ncbi:ABC transporter permease [Candidatus Woesearchaeota archaeon]|nr:ABC transporter permease [Candidatus Woesearchaeota archaeon]